MESNENLDIVNNGIEASVENEEIKAFGALFVSLITLGLSLVGVLIALITTNITISPRNIVIFGIIIFSLTFFHRTIKLKSISYLLSICVLALFFFKLMGISLLWSIIISIIITISTKLALFMIG